MEVPIPVLPLANIVKIEEEVDTENRLAVPLAVEEETVSIDPGVVVPSPSLLVVAS